MVAAVPCAGWLCWFATVASAPHSTQIRPLPFSFAMVSLLMVSPGILTRKVRTILCRWTKTIENDRNGQMRNGGAGLVTVNEGLLADKRDVLKPIFGRQKCQCFDFTRLKQGVVVSDQTVGFVHPPPYIVDSHTTCLAQPGQAWTCFSLLALPTFPFRGLRTIMQHRNGKEPPSPFWDCNF